MSYVNEEKDLRGLGHMQLVLYLFMLLQLGFLSLFVFYHFVELYNEFWFYFGCAVNAFCMRFKGGCGVLFVVRWGWTLFDYL